MMAMPEHYWDFLSSEPEGSVVQYYLPSPRTAVSHIYNMRVMCHYTKPINE